jgi:hypothetical protein
MYTVDYFIEKFSNPALKWHIGNYTDGNGAYCALGHCGWRVGSQRSAEAREFWRLTYGDFGMDIPAINDGNAPEYQQSTPQERVLAALQDIKKLQQEQRVKEGNDVLNSFNPPLNMVEQTKELVH